MLSMMVGLRSIDPAEIMHFLLHPDPADLLSQVVWQSRVPRTFLVLVAGSALGVAGGLIDRKSTRLNSSHVSISYAVFCLKKKKRIESRQAQSFPKIQSKNTIYIKLATVQRIAPDMYTDKETAMREE